MEVRMKQILQVKMKQILQVICLGLLLQVFLQGKELAIVFLCEQDIGSKILKQCIGLVG